MMCCYAGCKLSQGKIKAKNIENVKMIPFPKPKTQRARCIAWIKCLGREDFGVENIKPGTVICSNHFIGGSGPSLKFPNPICFETEKNLKNIENCEPMECNSSAIQESLSETIPQVKIEPMEACNSSSLQNSVSGIVKDGPANSAISLTLASPKQNFFTEVVNDQNMVKTEASYSSSQIGTQDINCNKPKRFSSADILTIDGIIGTDIQDNSFDSGNIHGMVDGQIGNEKEPSTSLQNTCSSPECIRRNQAQIDLRTILSTFLDMQVMGWNAGYSKCFDGNVVISIMKNNERIVPHLVLKIDMEMKVTITIRQKPLQDNHLLNQVIPDKLTSISQFKALMSELLKWRPCEGVYENDLLALFKDRNSKNVKQANNSSSFLDESTNSVHHKHCSLLIKNKRCKTCIKLCCSLRSKRSEMKKRGITANQTLQLKEKLKRCQARNVNMKKKVNRRDIKLEVFMKQKGSEVEKKK